MAYSTRFDDALAWASELHRHQVRKGNDIPYITHVLGVASTVGANGGDEDQVIGALLHDAIEDCLEDVPDVREQIRERFGARVLEIVEGCTDATTSPKPPWEERKTKYIHHIETLPNHSPVLLVALSDKLYNARAILRDFREHRAAVWERFNAGHVGCAWYYDSLANIFCQKMPGQLSDELRRVVDAILIEGGPVKDFAEKHPHDNHLAVERFKKDLFGNFRVSDFLEALEVESVMYADSLTIVRMPHMHVELTLTVWPCVDVDESSDAATIAAFEAKANERLDEVLKEWADLGFRREGPAEPTTRKVPGTSSFVPVLEQTIVASPRSFDDCTGILYEVESKARDYAVRLPMPWIVAPEPKLSEEAEFSGHTDDPYGNPEAFGDEHGHWSGAGTDDVPEVVARAVEAGMLVLQDAWPLEGEFWNDGSGPGRISAARCRSYTHWNGGIGIGGGIRWELQVPFAYGADREHATPGVLMIQLDHGDMMQGIRDSRILWPAEAPVVEWSLLRGSQWSADLDAEALERVLSDR